MFEGEYQDVSGDDYFEGGSLSEDLEAPEISFEKQAVSRCPMCFENSLCMYHSSLFNAEDQLEQESVKENESKIVVDQIMLSSSISEHENPDKLDKGSLDTIGFLGRPSNKRYDV